MRIALLAGILCLSWADDGHSSNPLFDLLARLEYDQEVLGLIIGNGSIDGLNGTLYIESVRLKPKQKGIWNMAWSPCVVLSGIRYTGSQSELCNFIATLQSKCRNNIEIENLNLSTK